MSKIITTDYGEQYQTPSGKKTTKAVMTGSLASVGVGLASMGITLPCMNKVGKISKSCDPCAVSRAVYDTFGGGALPAKGVKIINLNENSIYFSPLERFPKFIRNLLDPLESVINGKNAFYNPLSKKIYINLEKFGLLTFHEMGHAYNHNCSNFWKYIQKCRPVMRYTAVILALTALIKRPKADGEKPKSGFDKVTTFIKNNVGKLVALTAVPIVAEELMATYRGNKMAAKFLSSDMLKRAKSANRLGAITYIVSAVTAGLNAFAASKLRDKIAHPEKV